MIVYGMSCIGDAVMVCGDKLYDTFIRCCMLIFKCDSHAALLFIIGHDGLLWPWGDGFKMRGEMSSGAAILAERRRDVFLW